MHSALERGRNRPDATVDPKSGAGMACVDLKDLEATLFPSQRAVLEGLTRPQPVRGDKAFLTGSYATLHDYFTRHDMAITRPKKDGEGNLRGGFGLSYEGGGTSQVEGTTVGNGSLGDRDAAILEIEGGATPGGIDGQEALETLVDNLLDEHTLLLHKPGDSPDREAEPDDVPTARIYFGKDLVGFAAPEEEGGLRPAEGVETLDEIESVEGPATAIELDAIPDVEVAEEKVITDEPLVSHYRAEEHEAAKEAAGDRIEKEAIEAAEGEVAELENDGVGQALPEIDEDEEDEGDESASAAEGDESPPAPKPAPKAKAKPKKGKK